MKKQLIKVSEYRSRFFEDGSKPATSTVRRWIESGYIPGERIGNLYFVDIAKLDRTGNPLVDMVLSAS